VVNPDSVKVIVSLAVALGLVLVFDPNFIIKAIFVAVTLLVGLKTQLRPDVGEPSVSIWRFSVTYKDNHLRFNKI
jgi:hypothetical protein